MYSTFEIDPAKRAPQIKGPPPPSPNQKLRWVPETLAVSVSQCSGYGGIAARRGKQLPPEPRDESRLTNGYPSIYQTLRVLPSSFVRVCPFVDIFFMATLAYLFRTAISSLVKPPRRADYAGEAVVFRHPPLPPRRGVAAWVPHSNGSNLSFPSQQSCQNLSWVKLHPENVAY